MDECIYCGDPITGDVLICRECAALLQLSGPIIPTAFFVGALLSARAAGLRGAEIRHTVERARLHRLSQIRTFGTLLQ